MEMRDIEYFAVVAEHGNLRRASEALGLSPPALSKSLRRLEQSLQATLVERTPKGVALTPVGTMLLAQASRLRVTLRDIKHEANDMRRGEAGHLRIGVGATTVEDLPAAYSALLNKAPGLTGQVIVADNDELLPALRRGELDLIFNVIPETPYAGCIQEHLFDDEFIVCAAPDHPLAKRKRVTMADLAREKWALSVPAVLNVQHLYQAFRDRGLPLPQVAVEARSIRVRAQICATTKLLCFVARRTVRQVAPNVRLTELKVPDLAWRRAVGVIYREDAYVSAAARRLIETLKRR